MPEVGLPVSEWAVQDSDHQIESSSASLDGRASPEGVDTLYALITAERLFSEEMGGILTGAG